MKFVLDSNIIFSALIKKSTTRNIILSDVFELHAPEYIFSEITKHKELLLKKSKMNEEELEQDKVGAYTTKELTKTINI
ncbi:MAG: PIN domain-containing protein [Candidatus Methanoperedens sp.]|nr:PIN domain-containing protein [Candidatus Methanoperedens sp.]